MIRSAVGIEDNRVRRGAEAEAEGEGEKREKETLKNPKIRERYRGWGLNRYLNKKNADNDLATSPGMRFGL